MNSGKVAFCIGATSGIGRDIALKLAHNKVSVGVAARNTEAGAQLVKEMKAINPKGTYVFFTTDATSMKDISRTCRNFNYVYDKLNYLIMSPGVNSLRGRIETQEGIDRKMALEYYGRVHSVQSLDPLLKQTGKTEDVRVLSILSGGIHAPYEELGDLPLKKNYSLSNASNAAGFYTDLAFDQFARNFGKTKVSFIHASTGFVSTSFKNAISLPLKYLASWLGYSFQTPEECAKSMVGNGLIAPHMGPTPEGKSAFHLMTPEGDEARKTRLHNDMYREAVWKHTNETLDAATNDKTYGCSS